MDAAPGTFVALPPPPLDGEGRLDCDLACAKCEYNLRGVSGGGACPECGLPAVGSWVYRNDTPRRSWLVCMTIITALILTLPLSELWYEAKGRTLSIPEWLWGEFAQAILAVLFGVATYISVRASPWKHTPIDAVPRFVRSRFVLRMTLLAVGPAAIAHLLFFVMRYLPVIWSDESGPVNLSETWSLVIELAAWVAKLVKPTFEAAMILYLSEGLGRLIRPFVRTTIRGFVVVALAGALIGTLEFLRSILFHVPAPASDMWGVLFYVPGALAPHVFWLLEWFLFFKLVVALIADLSQRNRTASTL